MDTLPRFRDYFANKSVLLTGGTGFIGMALIEGLLSASPDLQCIYVLVREKKGLSPAKRVTKLLSSEIFNHIPIEVKNKVVLIVGDITAENLGLKSEVLEVIRNNVSIVIHNAALIKFNRNISEAIIMNVLTTQRCIELAKNLRTLSAFIYSSTALVNSNISGNNKEVVYKTQRSPKEMIKLALESPSKLDVIAEIKSILIEGHLNSYSYSKQLAENLILEEMKEFSTGIVRPTLVYGFYDHQIPGWMGNSQSGHCNLIKGHIKGLLRCTFTKPDTNFWCVPCDYVVKGTLALIVSLGTQKEVQNAPQIIHLSNTESVNPLSLQDFTYILNSESWKNPCDSYFLLPRCRVRYGLRAKLYLAFMYLAALLFYIPESLLQLSPPWMRGIDVVRIQYNGMNYFGELSHSLPQLSIENAKKLNDRLHPDDQKMYSFDMTNVNWNRLVANSISWLRKYFFKDSCSVTWMHRAVQIGWLLGEGSLYFGIFIGTIVTHLVIGYILEFTMIYVLLVGFAVGLANAGFLIWI